MLGDGDAGAGIDRRNCRGGRLYCRTGPKLRFDGEEPPRRIAGSVPRDTSIRNWIADSLDRGIAADSGDAHLRYSRRKTICRTPLDLAFPVGPSPDNVYRNF